MNGLLDIDSELEELHRKLEQDIDDHLHMREGLSENHHFELWDRMMELEDERKRLAQN